MLLYIARNNYLSGKNKNIIFVDEVYDRFFFLKQIGRRAARYIKKKEKPKQARYNRTNIQQPQKAKQDKRCALGEGRSKK